MLRLTEVTIPDTVTSIGNYAFSGCSGLGSVSFPSSLNAIEIGAFSGCSALESVAIPASLTSIGVIAFSDCPSLKAFAVASGNPVFKSVSGLLLTKDGETLLFGVNGNVAIPNGVTFINSSAFSGCRGLTHVTIPNSVTYIGYSAFVGCSGLASVTIPNSVTSIGTSVFEGCSGLASVTIPNSVKNIEYSAFKDCSGLAGVAIPDSVTRIWGLAFSGCSGLTNITIGKSVTSIGISAFEGCSGLKTFSVAVGNPAYKSVSGLLLTQDEKTLVCGVNGDVTIPGSVTSIGNGAFSGLSGLANVTIPASVASIGSQAFSRCTGLAGVTIPESVESIEDDAFADCSGLTALFVPAAWEGTDRLEKASVPEGCTVVYGPLALSEGSRTYTPSAAGGQTLGVVANVAWTAKSSSWLTVRTGSGSGCGTIVYDVAANTGGERAAVITVGGGGVERTFTVTQARLEVTVTFMGNGGTPDTQTETYDAGTIDYLPDVSRMGYAFAGWWTAAGGGKQVAEGSQVTADTTFYAHWTTNRYAIALDRQGGSGGTASVTVVFGGAMPTVEVPSRRDCVFAGYYAERNGAGALYYWPSGRGARVWDRDYSATLYARWMAVDPNLSLSPAARNFGTNGGLFAVATAGSGTWEAVASDAWITLGAATGQAGHPVAYEVSPATEAEARRDTSMWTGKSTP